jgi:thiol-disulfide isomerase/thioredoxin
MSAEPLSQRRRQFLGATAFTLAASRLGITAAQAASSTPQLPSAGNFPSLDGATGWINSAPLAPDALRGKIVLVNFCTYTCINWLRSLPYVRAWAHKYKDQGLVVIGVHTPEFGFEKDLGNVRRAIEVMRIDYPVAVDSDYAIWRAFNNDYWPALYFIDAQGKIRHHKFGEGDYEQSERIIQRLLGDATSATIDRSLVVPHPDGIEMAADWDTLKSPENYVGYERTENFASPGGAVPDLPHDYSAPSRLALNHWALNGNWTMGTPATASNRANGRIAYRFHARDLHLVLGPADPRKPVHFRVSIDGQPPQGRHGLDVDGKGAGVITVPRLYQLVRQPPPIVDRLFEIEFAEPGAQAFAFTFG